MAKQNEKEMSFWDHVDELRGSLWRAILIVMVFFVVLFSIKDWLFQFVFYPLKDNFPVYKLLRTDFAMDLVNIELSAQFFVHLKVAVLCALVLSVPFIIYEIWKFIAPALYEKEKKAVVPAFSFATVLFYLGAAVGYFIVLPICLVFFSNYSVGEAVTNTITLTSYISMFTSMVFTTGLLFEFPTLAMVLSKLGIIGKQHLAKFRKEAIVVILILSAIITPADPFSMFVLAVPLYGLYEFSILICPTLKDNDLNN